MRFRLSLKEPTNGGLPVFLLFLPDSWGNDFAGAREVSNFDLDWYKSPRTLVGLQPPCPTIIRNIGGAPFLPSCFEKWRIRDRLSKHHQNIFSKKKYRNYSRLQNNCYPKIIPFFKTFHKEKQIFDGEVFSKSRKSWGTSFKIFEYLGEWLSNCLVK